MDEQDIVAALSCEEGLPRAALAAASEQRDRLAPRFIRLIEDYLDLPAPERPEKTPIFFIFHLLGDWREKSAYRSLARLLRLPDKEIGHLLGDAVTSTSNRVIAGVFDGDPQPIFDIILDASADEFTRSRMCEALSYLGLTGQIDHRTLSNFLRDSFATLSPQGPCYVWVGWQMAIAHLGLGELTSLVETAFKRGYIDSWWTRIEHFRRDLVQAETEAGREKWIADGDLTRFGDTIAELSHWAAFREPDPEEERRRQQAVVRHDQGRGLRLPIRSTKVGRNEPCPCGSGRKNKKCCGSAALQ
jgi:uncharacterized protein YchJ